MKKELEEVRKEFREIFPVFSEVEFFLYISAEENHFEDYTNEEIIAFASYLSETKALVVIDDFQIMFNGNFDDKEKHIERQ